MTQGDRSRVDEMIDRRLTLILSEADVQQVLNLTDCIELQAIAYQEYSAGHAVVPQRLRIRVPEHDGNSSYMPAHVPGVSSLGCKVVSSFHGNRERGLPSTLGSLVLLDDQTGFPIAFMASTYLTNSRTAAGGACAARALIRRDAHTVGVFGSGALARMTLEAFAAVMAIESVTVYSRQRENREAYASEMAAKLGLAVRAVDDPAVVAASDLVLTATTSRTPVFDAPLRPGATLVSVGSGRVDMAEFPASVIKGNRFFVESREFASKECGELLIPVAAGELTLDAICGEIGQVLSGTIAGRTGDEEVIAFKSAGLALQDMITARAVYEAALAQGIGQAIIMQGGTA